MLVEDERGAVTRPNVFRILHSPDETEQAHIERHTEHILRQLHTLLRPCAHPVIECNEMQAEKERELLILIGILQPLPRKERECSSQDLALHSAREEEAASGTDEGLSIAIKMLRSPEHLGKEGVQTVTH